MKEGKKDKRYLLSMSTPMLLAYLRAVEIEQGPGAGGVSAGGRAGGLEHPPAVCLRRRRPQFCP